MGFIVLGVVLGPVVLLLISFLIPQGRASRIFVEISAVLFFLSAVYLFINPASHVDCFYLPHIVWKLIALLTTVFVFVVSLLDKHYIISVLTFIQSITLAVFEIFNSPQEAVPFLSFNYDGKVLLLAGSFIMAFFIPITLIYLKKYFSQKKSVKIQEKQIEAGILLLMAAFAGLAAANSVTGLFLFCQWMYIAIGLFLRAFKNSGRKRAAGILIVQQLVLTVWMASIPFIYQKTGSLYINGLNAEIGEIRVLIAVMVFALAIVIGCLIPDRYIWETFFSMPTPVSGIAALILSVMSPIAVLLKFSFLFTGLNNKILTLMIIFGSLVMVGGAYYSCISRKAMQILQGILMSVAGWGISTIFISRESMFFTVGYTAAAAITVTFLFACVTILEYMKGTQDVEHMYNLHREMPEMTIFMSAAMIFFLFAPFYSALQRLLYVRFLADNPVSMLLTVTALILVSAVIFRWLSVLLSAGDKTSIESDSYPVIFRIILPIAFVLVAAANLMLGSVYHYFQYQPIPMGYLPAENIEAYSNLEGILYMLTPGKGLIYAGGAIIILGACFYIMHRLNKSEKTADDTQSRVFYHYSLTAWIPSGANPGIILRTGWISLMILIAGVALSCLK
jgi:formate hydrogenlyase subunit 3/multisubunit Na+/H+ antiporter MnhD subunit